MSILLDIIHLNNDLAYLIALGLLVVYLLLHLPSLPELRPLLVPHPPHPLGVIEADTCVDECRVAGLICEGEAVEQGHEVGVPRVGTSTGVLVTRQTRVAIAQEEGEGKGHKRDCRVTEGFAGDHYTRLMDTIYIHSRTA